MAAKIRMCFPLGSAVPRVPGAQATPDGQRWCAVFTPASFTFAIRQGGGDPARLTHEAVVAAFEKNFPCREEDRCPDCPFPPPPE